MSSPTRPTGTSNAASNRDSSPFSAAPPGAAAAAGSSSLPSNPGSSSSPDSDVASRSYSGRRFGSIIRLRPECVAAYKECHANCWPEVQKQITECQIHDCAPHSPLGTCSLLLFKLHAPLLTRDSEPRFIGGIACGRRHLPRPRDGLALFEFQVHGRRFRARHGPHAREPQSARMVVHDRQLSRGESWAACSISQLSKTKSGGFSCEG